MATRSASISWKKPRPLLARLLAARSQIPSLTRKAEPAATPPWRSLPQALTSLDEMLADQPFHRPRGCAVGKHGFRQHAFGKTEMVGQHALEYDTQVGGRREVTAFVKAGWPERR